MKKINFTKYSDLTKCDEEQIHLVGSIQPFGAMVVLDKFTLEIKFCSDNIVDFLGKSTQSILSLKVIDFLEFFNGQLTIEDITALQNGKKDLIRKTVTVQNANYTLSLYADESHIFSEIEELSPDQVIGYTDIIDESLGFINIVNKYDDFKSYCQAISEKIRKLIGYDRVMIYKFDADYNGEVFAESLQGDLEPFLGLNYPHTDIPRQAREIYKKNPIRILVDVNKSPISLCTLEEGASNASVDLSKSILRSVSPIHIEYLKNMKVTATLTLSIMIGQRLWGLVSCHHHSPKYISPLKRQSALLQTQFMASHIHHWERSENYGEVQEKEHIYQSILESALKSDEIFQSISSSSYFIGLTGSTGGAIVKDGAIYTFGKVPSNEQIVAIQKWMKENFERVFQSSEFSTYYEVAKSFSDSCSGILYYSLDQESDSAIIWFRQQLSEGKKWGGNMEEAGVKSKSLTPRASFESWEELISGKSEVWKAHEIQAGLRLGAYLEREMSIRNITYQKERYEKLNSELQQANEELNQFNWISSHDMKEPLRKIRLFIDQINADSESLNDQHAMFFSRIDAGAKRMQVLIDDLLNYAGLSKKNSFTHQPLNKLVGEVVDCYRTDNPGTRIQLGELGSISCIDFQIKQLFSNLLCNSIKFKKDDQNAQIEIVKTELSTDDLARIKPASPNDYIKIRYTDNGIGFSAEYNEQVFQVFQRLHDQNDYSGTGIGLAICKKIVETHKGFIYAEGELGKGTTFSIVLKDDTL